MTVRVDTKSLQNTLDNIEFNLPRGVADAGYDLCKNIQRNMRLELTKQNLRWRGNLWSGIQARRQTKMRSVVFVPIRGIWLDRMKPHAVQLKRGRLIRQWAMEKGSDRVKKIAERQGVIWVKPHPWIDYPYQLSLMRFPQILKNRADRAMIESKGG